MALALGTHWSLIAGSTAGNVNGCGFNPTNTSFPTDATATSATGNSPVISSASYNFVAGDVNNWIYIKAGTNWTPGFYKITSVASNAATVNATIGAAVQYSATFGTWMPNTVAGVATTGSPTGGTYGIDYSQVTAAALAATDLASTTGTTNPSTVTSVGAPFGINHTGNLIHVTAGTNWTQAWYEVVSVSVVTATLDRAVGTAASLTSGTAKTGGAASMNSTLDDDIFEAPLAVGGQWYWANGSLSLGEAVSISASAAGTAADPNWLIGYQTVRGDNPVGANRTTINCAAQSFTTATRWNVRNIIYTGTTASVFTSGANSSFVNCKFLNTSTTVARSGYSQASTTLTVNCEMQSYRGYATSGSSSCTIRACYIHDSDVGVRRTNSDTSYFSLLQCLVVCNITAAVQFTAAATGAISVQGNTLYGLEDKMGIGIDYAGVGNTFTENNIIYGFVTGVNRTSVNLQDYDNYNVYFDNTTNATNFAMGRNDITTNPTFTTVAELTGSTATTSGSVLTQTGAFSGITVGQDYLYIASGTGITAGYYGITAFDANTVTLDIAPGTSAVADKVWKITTGRNWAVGTNDKATGFPGAFNGSSTTGYLDIGAVQRQEAGTNTTVAYSFISG